MEKITQRPVSLHTVLIASAVVTPIVFLSSIPWLKTQSEWLVLTLGGLASLIVIGCSFALAALKDQRMDEWHRGAARFGAQWGWLVGAGLVPILLSFAPIQSLILAFAHAVDPDEGFTEQAVLMTFMAGFATVVLLQTLFTAIFSVSWRIWMSRAI